MQQMNLGDSETLNYGMKLKNHVLFSTVNVISKEHHLNSVLNHQISRMIIFHHKLDPLRFHHKEESLYMKALITMERK